MPNLEKMNLNYLLNRAYYEPMTHQNFHQCNEVLKEKEFQDSGTALVSFPGELCFTLKTMYPGLLVGIGNTHEAGDDATGEDKEGAEIKLGFTLDYVTGLPIIPGSTIKGVLHSAFEFHPDYAASKLDIGKDDIEECKKAIFEEGTGKIVFFDAMPIKADKNKHLFALENITPHPEAWKNPIPLTLLKIVPNVTFLFRFGFERWQDTDKIKGEKLKKAFREIICDLGIGAKTNVGFGAMEPVEEPAPYSYLEAKVEIPVCRNIECSNPALQKEDGTYQPFCLECIKKHKAARRSGKFGR